MILYNNITSRLFLAGSGYFPLEWKKANVIPLDKQINNVRKATDRFDFERLQEK